MDNKKLAQQKWRQERDMHMQKSACTFHKLADQQMIDHHFLVKLNMTGSDGYKINLICRKAFRLSMSSSTKNNVTPTKHYKGMCLLRAHYSTNTLHLQSYKSLVEDTWAFCMVKILGKVTQLTDSAVHVRSCVQEWWSDVDGFLNSPLKPAMFSGQYMY